MDPNFDRYRRQIDGSPAGRRFQSFRRRLFRSPNGKVLGVFSGIGESLGYSVCRVRWLGVIALLLIASSLGAHGLRVMVIVAAFFYLLVALLMQPPRAFPADPLDPSVIPPAPVAPPPIPANPRSRTPYGGQPPYPGGGMRPDFAVIDSHLDALNRRIQRMEAIVTDRQYDWERRMKS